MITAKFHLLASFVVYSFH